MISDGLYVAADMLLRDFVINVTIQILTVNNL